MLRGVIECSTTYVLSLVGCPFLAAQKRTDCVSNVMILLEGCRIVFMKRTCCVLYQKNTPADDEHVWTWKPSGRERSRKFSDERESFGLAEPSAQLAVSVRQHIYVYVGRVQHISTLKTLPHNNAATAASYDEYLISAVGFVSIRSSCVFANVSEAVCVSFQFAAARRFH